MILSPRDRERLRALAGEQMELAGSGPMQALVSKWRAHGAFSKSVGPMVSVELWTFAEEIIPPLMQCEGAEAREIEWELLSNRIPYTCFGDDTPIKDVYPVPLKRTFCPFGLPVRQQKADDSGSAGVGYTYQTYLQDLETDYAKLGQSTYTIDIAQTDRRIDELNAVFGDILPVCRAGESIEMPVGEDIIRLISMENLYVAMLECPELVHELFERLTLDYVEYVKAIQEQGLLLPTASWEHLNQGSMCYTDALPSQGTALRTEDIWGYLDAEEFNDVSPAMYNDFCVEHYRKLAALFGKISWGCCEKISSFWDQSVETIANIGKVSISAWCDTAMMGERLRGKDIVFLRKPTANFLGVTRELDEEAVMEYFRRDALHSSGCCVEIVQRDVYKLHQNPDKVKRYVALIRKAMDRYWKP